MGNFPSERTILTSVDRERNTDKFYEITSVDMGQAGALVIRRWGRRVSMYEDVLPTLDNKLHRQRWYTR